MQVFLILEKTEQPTDVKRPPIGKIGGCAVFREGGTTDFDRNFLRALRGCIIYCEGKRGEMKQSCAERAFRLHFKKSGGSPAAVEGVPTPRYDERKKE